MKKISKIMVSGILLILFFFGLVEVNADEGVTIPRSDGNGDVVYLGTTTKVVIPSEYIQPDVEFRAVWISAIVGDVQTFSTKAQYKKEILSILETLEYYNINVMIFHVRPFNDAFYESKYNNWSTYYNTNPTWDALPWIIEECHKRGIEFHAWLNPYRVTNNTSSSLSDIASRYKASNPASNPNNLLKGTDSVILNPGIPAVRTFLIDTCMELIENYDVDAIHFDDYFYDSGVDDSITRSIYNTNNLSIDDFRREQTNIFIESLSLAIRSYNQESGRRVQLGISPSGIWKSGDGVVTYNSDGDAITNGSSTTSSYQHYGNYLYSDTLKWINEEWIDYILPQTYWALEHDMCAYADLISWWNKVVKYKNVKLYSGMGLYLRDAAGDGSSWQTSDLEAYYQLMYNQTLEKVQGTAIFSYKTLKAAIGDTRGFVGAKELWNTPVILPEITTMEKIDINPVTNLQVGVTSAGYGLTFSKQQNAKFYIIYRSDKEITYSPTEVIDVIGNLTDEEEITYIDENILSGDYYYGVRAQSNSLTLSDGVSSPVDKDLEIEKVSLGDINNIFVSDNRFYRETVNIKWDRLSYPFGDEIKYRFEYSFDQNNWLEADCTIDKNDQINANIKIDEIVKKVYYRITAYNNIGMSVSLDNYFDVIAALGKVTNFIVVGDLYTQNKVKFVWNNNPNYSDIKYELEMSDDKENWETVKDVTSTSDVNNYINYSLPISAKTYYFRIKSSYLEMVGYSDVIEANVYHYLGEFNNLVVDKESIEGSVYAYGKEYVDICWDSLSYGGKTVNYSVGISYNAKDYIPARASNNSNYLTNANGVVTQRIYFNSTISKIYVLIEASVDDAYAYYEVIEIYLQPTFMLVDEIAKYMVNEQKAMVNQMGIFK